MALVVVVVVQHRGANSAKDNSGRESVEMVEFEFDDTVATVGKMVKNPLCASNNTHETAFGGGAGGKAGGLHEAIFAIDIDIGADMPYMPDMPVMPDMPQQQEDSIMLITPVQVQRPSQLRQSNTDGLVDSDDEYSTGGSRLLISTHGTHGTHGMGIVNRLPTSGTIATSSSSTAAAAAAAAANLDGSLYDVSPASTDSETDAFFSSASVSGTDHSRGLQSLHSNLPVRALAGKLQSGAWSLKQYETAAREKARATYSTVQDARKADRARLGAAAGCSESWGINDPLGDSGSGSAGGTRMTAAVTKPQHTYSMATLLTRTDATAAAATPPIVALTTNSMYQSADDPNGAGTPAGRREARYSTATYDTRGGSTATAATAGKYENYLPDYAEIQELQPVTYAVVEEEIEVGSPESKAQWWCTRARGS